MPRYNPQAYLDREALNEREREKLGRYRASVSRGRYVNLLKGFDPREYASETATALAEDSAEARNREANRRARTMNRRGFFGANLGRAQSNRDFNDRLARSLARLSLDTAGMEMGRIDRFGDLYQSDVGVQERSRNRYLDLLAGNRDADLLRRQMETERRGQWFDFFGDVAGGAAGLFL